MVKADNYGIDYQLDLVYITKDGKKFINLDDAILHQKKVKENKK